MVFCDSKMTILVLLLVCLCTSAFQLGLRVPRLSTNRMSRLNLSGTESEKRVRIAVTREKGTNQQLVESLTGLDCIELPCIEYLPIMGAGELHDHILQHDYVLITSPHAAVVFEEAWKKIDSPAVKVASVGAGTTKQLAAGGIIPVFQPSEATGEALARELPISLGTKALFPCSELADHRMKDRLAARGITVTRLDTYTTAPVKHWTKAMTELGQSCQIATFASPSAAQCWAQRIGTDAKAVVIGPTTEAEARRLGFKEVFSPPGPSGGLEPFAELIRNVALGKC